MKGKYIILEIVPSHSKSEFGYIVQLQALKLDGLKLIDRFDYRVIDELVLNKELLQMISYDKDKFNYTENKDAILLEFVKWSDGLKLLIIDNDYTIDYLKGLPNEKESIFKYLNTEYSDLVIENLINEYHLTPSNNIVDLLYEALIFNNR